MHRNMRFNEVWRKWFDRRREKKHTEGKGSLSVLCGMGRTWRVVRFWERKRRDVEGASGAIGVTIGVVIGTSDAVPFFVDRRGGGDVVVALGTVILVVILVAILVFVGVV